VAMTEKFEVSLDIPDVKIVKTEVNRVGDLVITVESTVDGTHCHQCGRWVTKSYGHDKEILLRHLSVFGRKTYIRLRPKRYQCPYCEGRPTTTQRLSWYEPRSPHTKAYEEHVLRLLVNSTVSDVSIKENIGYEAVMGIVDRHVSQEVNWEEFESLDILGVDEIALKKKHNDFVTIVTAQSEEGEVRLLAVLKGRTKATVKEFFSCIPNRLRKTVRVVCSDLYDGFINAAKEVFGEGVDVVADRFHVAKLYRKELENVRKKEMKRLKEEQPKEVYKEFKGVMWMLRKKSDERTQEERDVLARVFEYSPLLGWAYVFTCTLTDIFQERISPCEARQKITAWMQIVEDSGLKLFNSFISTLNKRMDEITNYFQGRHSSGFVEGLNNKIKVIKRRCYGILNVGHLFQRIHIDLVGYARFS
jgi:transposase